MVDIEDTESGKERVVFLLHSVSSSNTGVGGHYRSVREFSRLLGDQYETCIITVGDLKSPVYTKEDTYYHVACNDERISVCSLAVSNYISSQYRINDKLINIFTVGSDGSCAIGRLVRKRYGCGHIHIKPGGPPSRRPWFYDGLSIVVFHKTDYKEFKHRDSKRPIALVVGRVVAPDYDANLLSIMFDSEQYDRNLVTVLFICRLSDEKMNAFGIIYSALERVNTLINLVHVGALQHRDAYDTAKSLGSSFANYLLITDEKFVSAAAKCIHGSDVVVGIGRVALEGLAAGKPVFVPVNDGSERSLLVAVTTYNWNVFADSNFTNRVSIADLARAGEIFLLEEVINQERVTLQLAEGSREIFKKYLSLQASKKILIDIISSNTKGKFGSFSGEFVRAILTVVHDIFCLRPFKWALSVLKRR